ncbi:diacylglycerol kinase family protein [Niabella soli]|uniref:DeoR family transcriptional regulator n=1 Tax=Niabella soli DSM 19437 TaxID=929713 RepID=W0F1U1_9BACT|nr:diacylglycerol kinase family protein [Niabella soli]AHF15444.1 DeoR family transcriptional regulator [Niabella soli DSM 19437]
MSSVLKKILRSFGYAFNGLREAVRSELNFRIHLFAAVLIILVCRFLGVSKIEWLLVIICISTVMALELINTAIEKLCDFVSPEKRPAIKIIKDLSAAAVLIAAIGALLIGMFIVLPKIIARL